LIDNPVERAINLLSNEFFQDVVRKQRELYIHSILNSPEDAVDARERALLKLRGLDEFIASLESTAKTADVVKKRWKIL
jgi:hypothetical protein